MSKSRSHVFMLTLSMAVTALTFASIGYIFISQPEYLHKDREGVHYFSPRVINPESGEAIPMNELIHHFKGE
ncbi:MAG: hypothetical protein H8E21_05920 [Gammaproteobacteria bacterium]|nr:hypothetical protein [Gammaproteobacteria bacterium]MBL6998404.1 hypothetical protein [Gammaproteobacteria bacterium]